MLEQGQPGFRAKGLSWVFGVRVSRFSYLRSLDELGVKNVTLWGGGGVEVLPVMFVL